MNEDNKIARTRKTGYKPITKKQSIKPTVKKGYFNPDKISKNDNWIFPNNKKYVKKII